MADEETEAEAESTTETTAEREADETDDVTIDVEAIDEYEQRIEKLSTTVEERDETIEELRSVVEEQSEQIERLEGQFLDLSARVADGRNLGVCPKCNGPTEKKERLFRSDTIECTRCGEVIHT
ncbi:MAG: hypothetical protein ACOCPY_01640, partial [Halorubrum sp.]